MEENSPKLHGKGQIFGMLRLALIPGFTGTRAALSTTSGKGLGQTETTRTDDTDLQIQNGPIELF